MNFKELPLFSKLNPKDQETLLILLTNCSNLNFFLINNIKTKWVDPTIVINDIGNLLASQLQNNWIAKNNTSAPTLLKYLLLIDNLLSKGLNDFYLRFTNNNSELSILNPNLTWIQHFELVQNLRIKELAKGLDTIELDESEKITFYFEFLDTVLSHIAKIESLLANSQLKILPIDSFYNVANAALTQQCSALLDMSIEEQKTFVNALSSVNTTYPQPILEPYGTSILGQPLKMDVKEYTYILNVNLNNTISTIVVDNSQSSKLGSETEDHNSFLEEIFSLWSNHQPNLTYDNINMIINYDLHKLHSTTTFLQILRIAACHALHIYLVQNKFTIITNHKNLYIKITTTKPGWVIPKQLEDKQILIQSIVEAPRIRHTDEDNDPIFSFWDHLYNLSKLTRLPLNNTTKIINKNLPSPDFIPHHELNNLLSSLPLQNTNLKPNGHMEVSFLLTEFKIFHSGVELDKPWYLGTPNSTFSEEFDLNTETLPPFTNIEPLYHPIPRDHHLKDLAYSLGKSTLFSPDANDTTTKVHDNFYTWIDELRTSKTTITFLPTLTYEHQHLILVTLNASGWIIQKAKGYFVISKEEATQFLAFTTPSFTYQLLIAAFNFTRQELWILPDWNMFYNTYTLFNSLARNQLPNTINDILINFLPYQHGNDTDEHYVVEEAETTTDSYEYLINTSDTHPELITHYSLFLAMRNSVYRRNAINVLAENFSMRLADAQLKTEDDIPYYEQINISDKSQLRKVPDWFTEFAYLAELPYHPAIKTSDLSQLHKIPPEFANKTQVMYKDWHEKHELLEDLYLWVFWNLNHIPEKG